MNNNFEIAFVAHVGEIIEDRRLNDEEKIKLINAWFEITHNRIITANREKL